MSESHEFDLKGGDEGSAAGIGHHRVVSRLPAWRSRAEPRASAETPARSATTQLDTPPRWHARIVECFHVVGALLCFTTAIAAIARIHFQLDQDLLTFGEFAAFLTLAAGSALVGRLVVNALRSRLGRAAARELTSPIPPHSGSDPSPRPPLRDSRC